MTDRLEIVVSVISIVTLLVVLELVRRRRLTEEYSFLWILSSVALLTLSLRSELLSSVTGWLGVDSSAPALLLLMVVTILAASLCFSVIVSRQRRQIERLIEETAILSSELRELRADQSSRSSELHRAGAERQSGRTKTSQTKSKPELIN